MGRIRTIKPEFPHSESMGRVSRDARLLFVQLWTICDDSGRTRASSRMLASLLFPYDDDAPSLLAGWLAELAGEGCIDLYQVEGSSYLSVRNWSKHQRIDRPSKPMFPDPIEGSRVPIEGSSEDLDQYQGPVPVPVPTTRAPARDKPKAPKRPAVERPEDVSEQTWADWLAHRKAKRATVTATVLSKLRSEAQRAGVTLDEAMATCAANGWQGFNAEWLNKTNGRAVGVRRAPGFNENKPEDYRKPGEDWVVDI